MIGAVAGFGPSTLIAPVGVLVRIVPVMARMLPVGVRSRSVRSKSGVGTSGGDESFKIPQCYSRRSPRRRVAQPLMRASPCSRSVIRSATSSIPTDSRTTFSGTARGVPRTEACVMSGG